MVGRDVQLEVQKQHLENLDKLIASFERNGTIYLTADTTNAVLDGNSSYTYDTLVKIRNEQAEKISSTSSQAAVYRKWIDPFTRDRQDESPDSAEALLSLEDVAETTEAVEGISESQTAAFQAQVDAIHDVLKQIIADFKTLLTAFNEKNINPGTVTVSAVKYDAPSLFSLSFVKQAVKTSIPVCALGFIFCLIILLPKMKQRFLH